MHAGGDRNRSNCALRKCIAILFDTLKVYSVLYNVMHLINQIDLYACSSKYFVKKIVLRVTATLNDGAHYFTERTGPDRTKFTHYSPERTGRLDIT